MSHAFLKDNLQDNLPDILKDKNVNQTIGGKIVLTNLKSKKSLIGAAVVLSGLLAQTQAFALVSAQMTVGMRTAKLDGKNRNATEYAVSGTIDPIPLVPVAAGATMVIQNWDKDDFGDDFGASKVTGTEFTLDVKGWLPMVPVITPYAKLSYVVVGAMVIEGDLEFEGNTVPGKTTVSTSGTHLTLGAQYPVLPLVNAVFEYGIGTQKIKTDDVSIPGATDPLESDDWKSNSYSVGINVGF